MPTELKRDQRAKICHLNGIIGKRDNKIKELENIISELAGIEDGKETVIIGYIAVGCVIGYLVASILFNIIKG